MTHPTQNPKLKTQNCCSNLSPEEQLIILSAQLNFDEKTARRFESILSGTHNPGRKAHPKPKTQNSKLLFQFPKPKALDWDYILESAQRLGIAPLLHKHLSKPDFSDKVPDQVFKVFKDEYGKQAFRSLRIQAQIGNLLNEAHKREIPVILLKGAALAGWIYKDIALRPMNDIDILCRDDDINKIKKMLLELGYYQDKSVFQSQLVEDISIEWGHLTPFHLKNGLPVEVHKNVFGKCVGGQSKKQLLWETAKKLETGGRPSYRLSNECMLLHLYLHLFTHMLEGNMALYWVSDILEFNQKTCNTLNWNLFWSLAADLRAKDEAVRVMATLNAHYDLSVSPSKPAIPNMKTFSLSSLMNTETSKKVRQSHFLTARIRYVRKTYFENGLGRAVQLIFRKLLPSKDYMRSRYPAVSDRWLRCYTSHLREICRCLFKSASVNLLN